MIRIVLLCCVNIIRIVIFQNKRLWHVTLSKQFYRYLECDHQFPFPFPRQVNFRFKAIFLLLLPMSATAIQRNTAAVENCEHSSYIHFHIADLNHTTDRPVNLPIESERSFQSDFPLPGNLVVHCTAMTVNGIVLGHLFSVSNLQSSQSGFEFLTIYKPKIKCD